MFEITSGFLEVSGFATDTVVLLALGNRDSLCRDLLP